jgi:hypothetical protein
MKIEGLEGALPQEAQAEDLGPQFVSQGRKA